MAQYQINVDDEFLKGLFLQGEARRAGAQSNLAGAGDRAVESEAV